MARYFKYIKKYWYCFVLGPVFMVLEATGEFLLPYINASIINNGVGKRASTSYILKCGGYMSALAVFMLITGVLGAYFAIKGSSNLAADIRKNTYKKIQKLSFSDIDKFSTGSLITRITNDITQVQSFTATLLRGVFRSPVMLIGALVMSFSLNAKLARVFLVVIPVLALLMFVIIRTCNPRYIKMQEGLDNLNTNIGETITNERVIKSFVREEYQKKNFRILNARLVKRTINALKIMMLMMPAYNIIINVTTLIVIAVSSRQINVGDMDIGSLTAFITYLNQVLMALNFMANIILQGSRAAASNRRIAEVLDYSVKLTDDTAKQPDKVIEKGDIEFRSVDFSYFENKNDNVLNNINLKIEGGSFVGIIGSTGSGKTTLVSLISRLYDTTKGEVFIDGTNVKDYSLYNLREGISFVLQKNTLFSGTVAENLRWGKENATDKEIKEAAKIACADAFIMAQKDGYDTETAQDGKNFSGGQKQRLCIARALLKKPKILILDDSVSAVDTATDAAIRKNLREYMPSTTKIVIAQRINSVIDADTIIVIDKGEIAGIGNHDTLIDSCLPYREIYLSQKDLNEGGAAS
ncbi:MAG: ABC transporter ATP-binding protein [Clostridia bacterium]|nr:ABC transporter ATP-binding protein [Clostridia bacterium]